jgi:hypothetical protein
MKFKTNVPDMEDIALTVEITMPVKEWRALRQQIHGSYPGWKFAKEVGDVIDQFSAGVNSQYVTDD